MTIKTKTDCGRQDKPLQATKRRTGMKSKLNRASTTTLEVTYTHVKREESYDAYNELDLSSLWEGRESTKDELMRQIKVKKKDFEKNKNDYNLKW